jgi:uncharacterized cupredoxin-like copper-binding protein
MTAARRPLLVGALVAAVIALVASAAVAVGAGSGGAVPGGVGFLFGSSPAAPSLPGTVVNVSLTDMGGSMMGRGNGMMGQRNRMMNGGAMSLSTDQAFVPHGTVSFVVINGGSIDHEMVILPLPSSQAVGARAIGGDAKIDETGSVGEASHSGGAGAGAGIVPGASGWVTVTLAPGQYELVCNLPRHYMAGMHTQFTVT